MAETEFGQSEVCSLLLAVVLAGQPLGLLLEIVNLVTLTLQGSKNRWF